MVYKVLAFIAPLVISSIISMPSKPTLDAPKVRISSKFSLLPISSEPTLDDYFDCTTTGPFSLSTVTNNVSVTFTYELYSISSQNIVERVRFFNSSNTVVSASSMASKYYYRGTRNSVTFSLPIRDYLTTNGLTLNFEIVSNSSYIIFGYANQCSGSGWENRRACYAGGDSARANRVCALLANRPIKNNCGPYCVYDL